ncbi:energy-coupled thiamine transporter ThiT [Macrococcus lamae]|uniref:Energy-coupled thiamine transporter ThiT n=1 Tax=Macrococcus lamae TaxID=198484 RepID=A0A4R6BTA2_9STAP|nr:energy-coupled thiamine transporter ThiT [Macrococcus lamae]TDM07691.1 energy-coupled thiamine transporter ThiT [Macrococcus lamae]
MKQRTRLTVMMEIAVMVALSMAIDLIDSGFKAGPYSFSFSMVPILILAVRRGLFPGVIAGLVWALLQLILGDASSIVHPAQFLIDYPLAFMMLGIAGISRHQKLPFILLFSALAIIARYFWHFISGIIFFGSYAPKGQPAWLYSLIVNGGTMLPNMIICLLIITLLYTAAKQLFYTKKSA